MFTRHVSLVTFPGEQMSQTSNNQPPVVMTIAGFDPSGGAGILADIKAIAAMGGYGVAAITSLTFQNTLGVTGAAHQARETVRRQIEPLLADFTIAAVKTGMLQIGRAHV